MAGAIKSKKLRDSARGEQCTLNIVGVCSYDPDTVILAHLSDETNGMGKKSDDLSSCYACDKCHDVIDGRAAFPEGEEEHFQWYLRRAMVRTLRRMVEKGVITIKGFNQGGT